MSGKVFIVALTYVLIMYGFACWLVALLGKFAILLIPSLTPITICEMLAIAGMGTTLGFGVGMIILLSHQTTDVNSSND